jgi:hypothetical protein
MHLVMLQNMPEPQTAGNSPWEEVNLSQLAHTLPTKWCWDLLPLLPWWTYPSLNSPTTAATATSSPSQKSALKLEMQCLFRGKIYLNNISGLQDWAKVEVQTIVPLGIPNLPSNWVRSNISLTWKVWLWDSSLKFPSFQREPTPKSLPPAAQNLQTWRILLGAKPKPAPVSASSPRT